MTETNFFYWLQGFFEIYTAGTVVPHPLEPEQVECIRRHLELVSGDDPGSNLAQIRNLINFAADGLGNLAPITARLKKLISDQFVHVIDPQAGGPEVQAKLNEIHEAFHVANPHLNPNATKRPDGAVARC